MAKLKPVDFVNPYPAYSSDTSDTETLNVTVVAVQWGRQEAQAAATISALRSALVTAGGPDLVEESAYTDPQGFRNHLFLTYWFRDGAADTWRHRKDVASWTDVVRYVGVGVWVESFDTTPDRWETSYSTSDPKWGMAARMPARLEDQHSYFGSMRDRIQAAEDDGLPAPAAEPVTPGPTQGRLIEVLVPSNAVFIRSPQGWSHCPPAQRAWFEQRMLDVYQAGVDHLVSHPQETGCLTSRLTSITSPTTTLVQTTNLAWFRSLWHLEQWAHQHPTHLAILKSFGELAREFAPDVSIVLGHEVFVVAAGTGIGRYLNCHAATGLLPHAARTTDLMAPDGAAPAPSAQQRAASR